MKFHYEFDIKKLSPGITHQHKMLLIGSCFTENIGEKLRKYKFNVLENPNGILFNPVSVSEAVTGYIENIKLNGEELFCFNEGWHSWKHHSRFSGLTADEAITKINVSTEKAHNYLKECDYVMITLGSAWKTNAKLRTRNGKSGRPLKRKRNNCKRLRSSGPTGDVPMAAALVTLLSEPVK